MALCLLIASTAHAVSFYWKPIAGGSGNWNISESLWNSTWTAPPGIPWVNSTVSLDSDAYFQGGTTGAIAVDPGGIQVHNITVGASTDTVANSYSFSGGPITLVGTTASLLTVTNATDTATISSAITSTVGFSKRGNGTLILSGDNSSSLVGGTVSIGVAADTTAVGGGALRVTNSNALGGPLTTTIINISGGVNTTGPVLNNSRLELDNGVTLSNIINLYSKKNVPEVLPPSGLIPASILNYGGDNTLTGQIRLLQNGSAAIIESAAGNLLIQGNIVNYSSTGTARNLDLRGDSGGEFSGTMGPGSAATGVNLWKDGAGTWIISGNNSTNTAAAYTTVLNGALQIKNNNALGGTSANAVTINTGTTSPGRLELNGSSSALTIPQAITLQGRADATNAHLANVGGSNSITGDILLIQGGASYLIQSDTGTLALNNIKNNSTGTGTRMVNLEGNGVVSGVIGGGTGVSPNDISIIKVGGGTWTLSGANTYTGATTVNGGTLSLGALGSISSSANAVVKLGAVLDVSASASAWSIPSLAGLGSINGTITSGGGLTVAPGVVEGTTNTPGTLTFNQNLDLRVGTGNILAFDLPQVPANPSDFLNVLGTLYVNNANKVRVDITRLQPTISNNIFPLIGYGTLGTGSGVTNFDLLGSGSYTTMVGRQKYELKSGVPGYTNQIVLEITGNVMALTWAGSATPANNKWDVNTTKSWTGSGPQYFLDGDTITFNNAGQASPPDVTLVGQLQPGSITFDSTANNFKFSGTGYISGATGITMSSSYTGKVTLANTGVNNYSGTTQIDAGTLQIGDGGANGSIGSGYVVNNAALVFNQSSNYATATTTIISGGGTLQKNGTGTLTLNGNSPSFTGAVTISGGTVVMGGANALGSTTATVALAISNNTALDVNGNIVGARNVSVQGAGPDGTSGAIVSSATTQQQNAFRYVTLTGNTTFGGSGRWDIRNNGGGTLTGGGYTLTKVGTNMVALVNLGETGLGTIDIKNGILEIEGTTTLGDTTKTVTVESSGMLSMYATGTNILNKNLVLQGGTLGTSLGSAGANNNFGGAVTLNGGGILSTAADISGTSGFTVSGSIGGTGLLTKSGTAGTVILTGTANSWNGGTTITGGTLQIGNGGANGSLPDAGTITIGTTINGGTLAFSSTNNITLANATITGTGGLTNYSSGTVTLGASNSYQGPTTLGYYDVGSGKLQVRNSDALGTSAVFIAGHNTCTTALVLDGSAGDLTIWNATITLAGRSDGATPGVNLAPHIINLAGNNSIINDISMVLNGSDYIFRSDAGKLTLNSITNSTGSNLDRYIYLQGAGDGEIDGSIQNASGTVGVLKIIKDGSGTWTLLSSNLYDTYGNTTIRQGTLALGPYAQLRGLGIQVMGGANYDVHNVTSYSLAGNQTLSGSGTVIGDIVDNPGTIISPGDTSGAGTLTFNNSSNTLTLYGGDFINYNISGATADLLDVKGNLTLSGTTTITVLPNQVVPGHVYTVANVAGLLTNGSSVTVDSSSTRYTFTHSVSLDGKQILLTAHGTNKSLAWNGLAGTWDINATAAWNTSDVFYNADDVTFGDTPGITSVSINSAVMPASVTVNSSNDYTFSGTGKITGDVGLVKQGSGTLTVNLANDYTGLTNIQGGTLRVGVGGTLGDTTNGTNITSGATLDTNGQNLGAEVITVQGDGVGLPGIGAIVNNSITTQMNALRFVTLAGNTTIGGTARWDIRANPTATLSTNGNAYNLTKVGTNLVSLVGVAVDPKLADVNVNQGTLRLETTSTLGDPAKTVTVASLASLEFFNLATLLDKKVSLNGGTISAVNNSLGTDNTVVGDVTVNSASTLNASGGASLTLSGALDGVGSVIKNGSGTVFLTGTPSYGGDTTINAGTLAINTGSAVLLHTISGAGNLIVDNTSSLTADSISVSTLTIGAGSVVTIAPIPGGSLSGSGSLSSVPEPSTWTMLVLAAMGLGIYWRCSCVLFKSKFKY
jgi:autotransporter-associated beta strand protein